MAKNVFKNIHYVYTGEVRSGGTDTILNSGAIGSCVVITALDPEKKIGAMAHVLLPGTFPLKTQLHSTKYANNAIEEMLKQLYSFDVKKENIEVCLVGGANVLKRKGDIIGKDNLDAVEKLLREKHIEIKAKAVGGFERRTVIFDIENGCISYSVGNSKQNILWQTLLKR